MAKSVNCSVNCSGTEYTGWLNVVWLGFASPDWYSTLLCSITAEGSLLGLCTVHACPPFSDLAGDSVGALVLVLPLPFAVSTIVSPIDRGLGINRPELVRTTSCAAIRGLGKRGLSDVDWRAAEGDARGLSDMRVTPLESVPAYVSMGRHGSAWVSMGQA